MNLAWAQSSTRVDATTSLTLAFDLGHSLIQTGNGRYMLKPVVKASGDVTSGVVNGKVTFKGGRAVQDAGVEAKSANNTYLTQTSSDGLYGFLAVAAPATYEFTFRLQTPENVVYLNKKASRPTPQPPSMPSLNSPVGLRSRSNRQWLPAMSRWKSRMPAMLR